MKRALEALDAGRAAEASDLLEQAAAASGKRPVEINFYRGAVAQQAGRTQEAEDYLEAFVALRGDAPGGYYQLGLLQEALGKGGSAVESYKSALIVMIRNARIYFGRSGKGSADDLERAEKAAKSGKPADKLILGHVLELRGKLDDALVIYRELVEAQSAKHNIDLKKPDRLKKPLPL